MTSLRLNSMMGSRTINQQEKVLQVRSGAASGLRPLLLITVKCGVM